MESGADFVAAGMPEASRLTIQVSAQRQKLRFRPIEPAEARHKAEQELEEFKRNMNANRVAAGEIPIS